MKKGQLIILLVLFLPSPGTAGFVAPVPEVEEQIIDPWDHKYDSLSDRVWTPTLYPPDEVVEIEEEQPIVATVEEETEAVFSLEPEKVIDPEPKEIVYPYPEYIRVIITGTQECDDSGAYQRVAKVPFKEYTKVVLANEWGRYWNEESLKAGAVAVKMFAWYAVETGGKWYAGNVYDCDWDMVYNPRLQFDTTDRAVDDTWDYYLLDSEGDLFMPHFVAWYGACLNWLGDTGKCMGQWDSLADAENGMTWTEILKKYYRDTELVKIKGE